LVGAIFLNEHPEARHLLALCLILGGVLTSQLDARRQLVGGETEEEARSVA